MQNSKSQLRRLSLFLLSFFIVGIFFSLNYAYDNKYTAKAPRPQNGVLALSASELANSPSIPLIQGWHFYPDRLLTPGQAAEDRSFREISIGEYDDFGPLLSSGSPLGSATYALDVAYQGQPMRLSLFLPEIFSSYNLYIDGALATSCGDPVDYAPFLQYRIINFIIEGNTQILFQVSNQTHYYSGLCYAPVLGTQSSIMYLALSIICVSALFSFSSLALCLFTLGLWLTQRRHLYSTFGALCLSFALYVSYPLWRFFGSSSPKLLFCLKDLSFTLLLICALAVTAELCGLARHKYIKGLIPVCAVYYIWTLVFSFLSPLLVSRLLFLRDFAADGFLLLIAFSILWCVLRSPARGQRPTLLILASAIFSLGLLAGHFSTGKFEPLRFLWPVDYCAALLVFCFSVLMVKESFRLARENRRLTDHLEEEVELRTRQLEALSEERKRFLADVSHDLKAPLSAIHSYMELIRLGNLQLDKETQSYLNVIEQKSEEMTRRVTTLQAFSHQELPTGPKERISVSEFLMEVHRSNQPDTDASGIYFVLLPNTEPLFFLGWRDKCERVLENLIYNAISFTPAGGTITLGSARQEDAVLITVADTGCGIPESQLEHIFEQGVSLRSEDNAEHGLGLYFARTTARELGGDLFARTPAGGGAEFCLLLPLCP